MCTHSYSQNPVFSFFGEAYSWTIVILGRYTFFASPTPQITNAETVTTVYEHEQHQTDEKHAYSGGNQLIMKFRRLFGLTSYYKNNTSSQGDSYGTETQAKSTRRGRKRRAIGQNTNGFLFVVLFRRHNRSFSRFVASSRPLLVQSLLRSQSSIREETTRLQKSFSGTETLQTATIGQMNVAANMRRPPLLFRLLY